MREFKQASGHSCLRFHWYVSSAHDDLRILQALIDALPDSVPFWRNSVDARAVFLHSGISWWSSVNVTIPLLTIGLHWSPKTTLFPYFGSFEHGHSTVDTSQVYGMILAWGFATSLDCLFFFSLASMPTVDHLGICHMCSTRCHMCSTRAVQAKSRSIVLFLFFIGQGWNERRLCCNVK